jgi:hypothetical protein
MVRRRSEEEIRRLVSGVYAGCLWCDTIFEPHPVHDGKPCIWKEYGCNCAREDPERADRMVEENIAKWKAHSLQSKKAK